MKKFNVDEFIWFIIQIFLIILMIYLKVSEKITYFIGSKMIIYFRVSIIILILYSLAQFNRIFTVRSRNYITNKFLPILSFVILSILFLYVAPNYKMLRTGLNEEGTINKNQNEDFIKITNDNYEVLSYMEENHDSYNNNIIEMIGFVYKNSNNSDEAILGREVVSCCQSDKSVIQIKVKGINNIKKGTWLKVVGKIKYDEGLYLECIDFQKVDEPIEIYFHEKL